MIITTFICTVLTVKIAESAILDPSMFLVPSPPLKLSSEDISPGERWLQSVDSNTERVVRDVSQTSDEMELSTQKQEIFETGRMFWPRFSQPQPALGIHIPLTFSMSGSYGKSSVPSGVIGNTYASVPNLSTGLTSSFFGKTALSGVYGNYGRSALAGSSYGTYGLGSAVRIYGSDNAPSWSGWGNGKWGHYGKG